MPDLPDDPELLNLLDAYLRQIQAGQPPDRDSVLRQRPELASMLACLDALESMAIPSDQGDQGQVTLAFSPEEVPVPRDFGAYELLGEIGRGGMGVVYKARQRGLERVVAIKMILASHLASTEHVRRFQDEARAAASLRHPNIVHIHDVGQCHGQHFFTMEYIEGRSLAEHIALGRLEIDPAARLVAKVARAVHHLHQQGVVHRDLKPSNILLDHEGEPYVTDFGLAKFFAADSAVTATGVIAGTPCYMAPEQASGQRGQVGPACDIYSLGAILYELLTGRPRSLASSTGASPGNWSGSASNAWPARPRTATPRPPHWPTISITSSRKRFRKRGRPVFSSGSGVGPGANPPWPPA
jgi:eukaryotic-like serine/threonine-protein kinase